MTSGIGLCACGCGEQITHPGATYAGEDEATRNRHRARAAYKRKNQGPDVQQPGTREALAKLGLADDVPVAELAKYVAAAMTELARRTAGVDSASIQQEIERGLVDARSKVQEAEAAAEKARADRLTVIEQLTAAIERADQADEDAASAAGRAEALEGQVSKLSETIGKADRELAAATSVKEEAVREAQQAKALVETLKAEHARLIEEVRRTAASDTAVKLAEQRQEFTEKLAAVNAELGIERTGHVAEKARADRLDADVIALRERLDEADEEAKELRGKAAALSSQLETSERERRQAIEARERVDVELTTVRGELGEARTQLGISRSEAESARRRVEELTSELAGVRTEVTAARTEAEQQRQRADRAVWELEQRPQTPESGTTTRGRGNK